MRSSLDTGCLRSKFHTTMYKVVGLLVDFVNTKGNCINLNYFFTCDFPHSTQGKCAFLMSAKLTNRP